jgi:NADH-quinone oxidoreductase subunit H
MTCTGLCDVLVNLGFDPGLSQFVSLLIGVTLVAGIPLLTVILLVWAERKFAGRVQDRIGPNRLGPFGLIQTFADLLKLLIKEDITPKAADRLLYNFAPVLMVVSVVLIWAVVPFTPYHYGVDLEIGALYLIAVASLGTLAIMTAGWASNNKYALLGAFRVVALLVSYEIPLVISLLVPVVLAGSMSLLDIVHSQGAMYFAFMAPVALLIFFISAQAETGRAPFDLIEAESEIVAGFNIEYSGMKFGMFFAGEFLHVFTNAVLITLLFLGGWYGPGWHLPLVAFFWLGFKSLLPYLVSIWLRNTTPRLRIDQVMSFNWKVLVPASIANLLITTLVLRIMQTLNLVPVDENNVMQLIGASLGEVLPLTIVLFAVNMVFAFWLLSRLRAAGRDERVQQVTTNNPMMATAVGD